MTLGRKKWVSGSMWPVREWIVTFLQPMTTGGLSLTFGAELMVSSPIFFLNKPFLPGKTIPNVVSERKQNIVGHFSASNGLWSPWPVSNYHCFLASGVQANENTFFSLLAFFSTQNPPRGPLAVLDTLLDRSCDSTLAGKTEELSFLRCKDCVRPLALCAGAEYTTT